MIELYLSVFKRYLIRVYQLVHVQFYILEYETDCIEYDYFVHIAAKYKGNSFKRIKVKSNSIASIHESFLYHYKKCPAFELAADSRYVQQRRYMSAALESQEFKDALVLESVFPGMINEKTTV